MAYGKKIKIIVTGCPRSTEGAIDKIIEKPAKENHWPDRLIQSIKAWLATLLHGKPVVVIKEEEGEPLLKETRVFKPKQTTTSFLKGPTTRRMTKFNEIF